MATVNPVWRVWENPNNADIYGDGKAHVGVQPPWLLVTISWTGVNGGDTCVAAPAGFLTDLSCQFSGTTVTSVALTGSNDGTEYYVLNDPQGNALTGIGTEKIEQLLERTIFVKPTATTATAANFVLCGRLPQT